MIFLKKKSLQKQIQSKFCTNLVLVFSWHAVVHLNKQLDISSFFGGKKTPAYSIPVWNNGSTRDLIQTVSLAVETAAYFI